MENPNIVITGASGLLGRAVMKKFLSEKCENVIGTAFSRSGPNLKRVDLTNTDEIKTFVQDVRPKILIHSAAQRFPDKLQKDPEAGRKLNVLATQTLAQELSMCNYIIFFILQCFMNILI